MFVWLFLLLLIGAEVAAISRWLRREFYPIFFNDWAAFLYSALMAVDFSAAWLISIFFTPGGTFGTALLAILAVILMILVLLGTLFLRWVVHLDMTDPGK
ncbi:MAG: hypothetical protein IVW55_11150 [Chloroflexi bacterium]|nr:hypothetical protein [Chloroflexota bacterium]